MTRSTTVAIVLAAWLTGAAVAAEYTEFQSRRYDVITDLPIDRAKPIALHMDRVFDEYTRRLARAGFRSRTGDRMNLYLFDHADTYRSELGGKGIDATGSGGMFFVRGGESALATFVTGRSHGEMIATLQHEGFHQFAWIRIGPNLPTWANEGLAEYFGDALLVKGRFAMGQVDGRRLSKIREAIDKDEAFGFGELLNMTGEEWIGRLHRRDPRAGLMYDQSWSIVHFLVHGNNGRFQPAFMAYLREINKGRSSEQAFEAAFGSTDYAPFEAAWKRYITDLDADPLTIANERLNFLAGGLRRLHARGTTVESIDALKRELRKINYWYSISSHGRQRRMDASDETNFQPPPPERRGRNVTLELAPPAEPGMPPVIVVRGLQVEVRTEWSRDADGDLTWQIVYR